MVEEIPRGHMRMLHGGDSECVCKNAGVDAKGYMKMVEDK